MNKVKQLKTILTGDQTKKGVVIQSGELLVVSFSGEVFTFPKQDFSVGDTVIYKNGILEKQIKPSSFFEV